MVSLRVVLATIVWVIASQACSTEKAAEVLKAPSERAVMDRTEWYREAKFGMFIHWGPYSLASVEPSWPIMRPVEGDYWFSAAKYYHPISETDYVALPKEFNPVRFNPEAWVKLAKSAGQRYMVFTTKHHDGFCMFDSSHTDYKITNTPYGKDIVAELAAACRKERMPLGFYYSPPDMNHPGFRDTSKLAKENWEGEPERPEWSEYLDYMEAQLTELLTRYGEVAIVWFDGLRNQEKYDGERFHKLIHDLQPATLINDRIGLPGDYGTPEQFIPDQIPTKGRDWKKMRETSRGKGSEAPVTVPPTEEFRLWETCTPIGHTWSYNEADTDYKSAPDLIRALVEVASKGGNLLLNVGPTPEGTIQPEFEERLLAIGEWLDVNGESIYGTNYGPLQNLAFGKTTAKGNKIYVHVFDWPDNALEFDGLTDEVSKVTLLSKNQPLPFKQDGGRIIIDVPAQAPDSIVTVLVLEL
jgi:alpha-L-fucosidase